MLQKTIELFQNPRQILNTTYFQAQGVGERASAFTRYNFKYKFIPPTLASLRLIPITLTEDPLEQFDEEMFRAGGFLHETPLNFFLKLTPYSKWFKPQPAVLLQAGYLLNHLLMGDDIFYKELKRLINTVQDIPITKISNNENDEITAASIE